MPGLIGHLTTTAVFPAFVLLPSAMLDVQYRLG